MSVLLSTAAHNGPFVNLVWVLLKLLTFLVAQRRILLDSALFLSVSPPQQHGPHGCCQSCQPSVLTVLTRELVFEPLEPLYVSGLPPEDEETALRARP